MEGFKRAKAPSALATDYLFGSITAFFKMLALYFSAYFSFYFSIILTKNVLNSSCGKIMFLHLSVILFMGVIHGRGCAS